MVVPICSKLRGYMGKEHPLKIKIRQKFNENMDEILAIRGLNLWASLVHAIWSSD